MHAGGFAHVHLHCPQSRGLISRLKAENTGEKQALLSPREQVILDHLAKGLTYQQIADELGISVNTIRTYLRRVYEKLHVQSRTAAVAKYLRL